MKNVKIIAGPTGAEAFDALLNYFGVEDTHFYLFHCPQGIITGRTAAEEYQLAAVIWTEWELGRDLSTYFMERLCMIGKRGLMLVDY